ncbi:MAG: tetratricopeptide repeat protein [Candidatus Krumholzibacteriia bacterium]
MRRWPALLAVVLLLPAVVAAAAEPPAAADPDRAQRQAAIESDASLPERARATLFRARTSLDDGDPAAAADVLQAWLGGDPGRDHHLLRFELGAALLADGRAEAARAELRAAVGLEPAFARAWLRLGEAAYEGAQYTEAADAFVRAYALLPDPPAEILHYAAVCRLQAGDAAGACDLLAPLVAADPAGAPFAWHQALAAAAIEAGTPARARGPLAALLAARPDDRAVWDLAWRFAAGSGDYRDAAVLLKAEGFLAELDAAELEQLGELFAAVGIPLEAARAWTRAAELRRGGEGGEGDGTARLARAWLAAHEPGQARAVLADALAARGEDAALLALLGEVALAAEDHAGALDAFARAAAADPDDGRAALMAGWCALELDRLGEARRFLSAAAAFPEQAEAARGLLGRLGGE